MCYSFFVCEWLHGGSCDQALRPARGRRVSRRLRLHAILTDHTPYTTVRSVNECSGDFPTQGQRPQAPTICAPPPPIQTLRIRKEVKGKNLGTNLRKRQTNFFVTGPLVPLPPPQIPQTTYRKRKPPQPRKKTKKIENRIGSAESSCFLLFSANSFSQIKPKSRKKIRKTTSKIPFLHRHSTIRSRFSFFSKPPRISLLPLALTIRSSPFVD